MPVVCLGTLNEEVKFVIILVSSKTSKLYDGVRVNSFESIILCLMKVHKTNTLCIAR